MTKCLHVKITATDEELRKEGIAKSTRQVLLSGTFAVDRTSLCNFTGKKRVWLVNPTTGSDGWIWVWEEMTERIAGG